MSNVVSLSDFTCPSMNSTLNMLLCAMRTDALQVPHAELCRSPPAR